MVSVREELRQRLLYAAEQFACRSRVEITPVQDFGELLALPKELVTMGNKHFGASKESENFTAVHRRIPHLWSEGFDALRKQSYQSADNLTTTNLSAPGIVAQRQQARP